MTGQGAVRTALQRRQPALESGAAMTRHDDDVVWLSLESSAADQRDLDLHVSRPGDRIDSGIILWVMLSYTSGA